MAETHQQMLLLIKADYLPDMNQASFAAWNVNASTRHSSFVRERTDWLETGETDKAQSCAMSTFTSHPTRTNERNQPTQRKYITEDQFYWSDIGHLCCWLNRLQNRSATKMELIAPSKRALLRVKLRSNEGVGSRFTGIFK